MSVSIREIAKMAGVSRGTVDRALNDRPGINPELKARILNIARDVDYRSNKAGRMLGLRKKPLCFGIQMPSQGNDFFIDVRRGISAAMQELADFGLSSKILTMKGFSVEKQLSQIRQLLDEGIHGLIFVPIDHPKITALLDELQEKQIPVITFNNDIEHGCRLSYVGNDYIASGQIAAGLIGLLSAGSPLKTLIMTGSVQVLGHNQRISGFHDVIKSDYPQVDIVDVLECQDDDQVARERISRALEQRPDVQALYITAGGVAGACEAIRVRGCAGKIKVVSFDLTDRTKAFLKEGLITATIEQEPYQQGYRPVKLLFDYFLDGTKPPQRCLTHNRILIREHVMNLDTIGADVPKEQ